MQRIKLDPVSTQKVLRGIPLSEKVSPFKLNMQYAGMNLRTLLVKNLNFSQLNSVERWALEFMQRKRLKKNETVKTILIGYALKTKEYDATKGNWSHVRINKKEGIKVLAGPISFVNHSCKKHANSKMVKQQKIFESKEKIVKKFHVEILPCCTINKGDAITFSYGQGFNSIKCSQCNSEINKQTLLYSCFLAFLRILASPSFSP